MNKYSTMKMKARTAIHFKDRICQIFNKINCFLILIVLKIRAFFLEEQTFHQVELFKTVLDTKMLPIQRAKPRLRTARSTQNSKLLF